MRGWGCEGVGVWGDGDVRGWDTGMRGWDIKVLHVVYCCHDLECEVDSCKNV